jgi:GDP-4-dehydro-6-deoxy-D-mannose reductase
MRAYQRILSSGGTGFVGRLLARAISSAYPEATLVNLARPDANEKLEGWDSIEVDLVDPTSVNSAVAKVRPDLVLHLAAQSSGLKAVQGAEATWRTNVLGVLNLSAALARHAPTTTVLFSSSATVYGASLRQGMATEDTPVWPLVLPGATKLIVARPVNHSGAGQISTNFVLPSFAAQIAAIESGRRSPTITVGDLTKSRDFLDVRDVVAAYMALIAAAETFSDRLTLFNIGSGFASRLGDLLDDLLSRASRKVEVVVDQRLLRPSDTDVATVVCDAKRLRDTTGWKPQFGVGEMLGNLLEFWREREWRRTDTS